MSVSAHLNCVVSALATDVAPVLGSNERAQAALAASLDVLRQLIAHARDSDEDAQLLRGAADALELALPQRAPDEERVMDTADQYFGGRAFHHASVEQARQAIASSQPTRFSKMIPVVQWERAGLLRVEESYKRSQPESAASDAAELLIDPKQLLQYFQSKFSRGAAVEMAEFRQIAGGRSKQTAIFRLSGVPELPGRLVVRRDHPVGITKSSVVDEYGLLVRLFEAGIAVPRPYFVETDASKLSGAFLVLEALDGKSVGGLFDRPRSPALARALAQVVGRLHSLDASSFVDLTPRLAVPPDNSMEMRLGELEQMWVQTQAPPFATMELAFAWLRANIALARGPLTVIHNDLGFQNVLADGDSFKALLDWEFAALGNPAEDVGYLRPTVELAMDWEDWMQTYRGAGGPDLPPAQVDYFAVWSWTRLSCLVAYARFLINSSSVIDVSFALSSVMDLNRCLKRVADNLVRVL